LAAGLGAESRIVGSALWWALAGFPVALRSIMLLSRAIALSGTMKVRDRGASL